MGAVRDCLLKRRYSFSNHALLRLKEREILHTELITALANGKWLKRKDRKTAEGWSYYIHGETLDGHDLGIVVALVGKPITTIVITVIDLKGEMP